MQIVCSTGTAVLMGGVAAGNTIDGVRIRDLRIQGKRVTSLQEGDVKVSGSMSNITFHDGESGAASPMREP